jgi:hypothetical protein
MENIVRRRKRAHGGANGIHQHRQEQRPRAAEPIGHTAEEDPADGPPDQEQRGEDAGPLERRRAGAARVRWAAAPV